MHSRLSAMQTHQNHDTALLEKLSPPARVENVSVETMAGSIERVDLVQRELTVSVGPRRVEVDVPPQCQVMLRGERIKLRIIQPGDFVRISFVQRAARSVAQRVEVAPINSLPAAGKT